jgi:NTP pyrophosphatase (non-canonical NTP hydrolase)
VKLDEIFDAIFEERRRQEFLKSQGKFPWTCADAAPASMKLAVLAEEFGEVAKEVCDQRWDLLRDELVQVAAVCVAWLESMDQVK